jgi:hypothetical protein
MHGIGALACFDGCKLYGQWHLGRRHGHFLIQRPLAKDCQVMLYDLDVPVWSRCMVSSDLVELSTPSIAVMVQVETMCSDIETHCADRAQFFTDRVKASTEYLDANVLQNVKACVEQARFHSCQHALFNMAFGISSDDIKVIRVDGERRNVYLRDFDLFNQGVDDDVAAAAAKDVSTTQKIVRIVQRLQKSIAQGPEPEKILRKSKAELQAEASAKAAEQASNVLENAMHEYSHLLKNEKTQMLDKLVLLITVLQKVPAQAKLTAEHVLKLTTMQTNESDMLKVIRHFFTASDAANNFDWERRAYVPPGARRRGDKRQNKELVALPLFWLEKFLRLLQNISGSDLFKEEASKTAEHIREWAYYCQLAEENNLARFRAFVDVKNHFARAGKVVTAPVSGAQIEALKFDDDLLKRYTAEKAIQSSDGAVKRASDDSESSGSDGSVDFSLQTRRFQPMATAEMRLSQLADVRVSAPNGAAASNKAAAVITGISDSDNDSDVADGITHIIEAHNAAAPPFPPSRSPTSSAARNSGGVRSVLAQALAPNLTFSAMKRGSATQAAARRRDLLRRGSSSSDDAS